MDNVEFDGTPAANLTTMVMAFGGWIDAGRAATGALRHLVRDLPASRLARINPEEFFVFTQERPEVSLRADGGRDLHCAKAGAVRSDRRPGVHARESCRSDCPGADGELFHGVILWFEAA